MQNDLASYINHMSYRTLDSYVYPDASSLIRSMRMGQSWVFFSNVFVSIHVLYFYLFLLFAFLVHPVSCPAFAQKCSLLVPLPSETLTVSILWRYMYMCMYIFGYVIHFQSIESNFQGFIHHFVHRFRIRNIELFLSVAYVTVFSPGTGLLFRKIYIAWCLFLLGIK